MKVKEKEESKKGNIKVLTYDDEDLISMVENDLEWQYGYECNDTETFESMKITHKNMYTLLWFHREMENGGLGEYLFSISNCTMKYLEKSFEDINALELLENYKTFLKENNIAAAIGKISKRSVEEYTQFMSSFDFSSFNNLYEKTNIRELLANYIRNNIIDFSDLSEEELKVLRDMEEEEKLMKNN